MNKLINWIQDNKVEAAIIFLILLTAAFLRLWRISEYMTFLGDEGRDVLVVKALITKGDLILIGPPTSIGNMYLGPIYYYMMAPALALTRLNPVGPAILDALIGIATVFLVYLFGREWFGKVAGLTAAALYAVSPVAIIYSHSSWNPNPAPFFAILTIYSLYQVLAKKKLWWLIAGAAAMAATLQMHYLATLLIPTFGIFWLAGFIKFRKEFLTKYLIFSTLGIAAFLLVMSPLFLFDFRHNFINYKAFVKFFTERQTTVNANPANFLIRIPPLYESLFSRFLAAKDKVLGIALTLFVTASLVVLWWRKIKTRTANWQLTIITVWVIVGIFGLAAYKLSIFDHYFGFLNPAAFLLFGLVISLVWQKRFLGKIFATIIVFGLVILNLLQTPIRYPGSNQLERTQKIAKIVISETDNKPYNFALIAQHNYDAAYQYYLELYNAKPERVDFVQTEQLFVVCEDKICQPIGHPKSEIARFGYAKIDRQWDISGVKLFKLVKNPEGKPQIELPQEERIIL